MDKKLISRRTARIVLVVSICIFFGSLLSLLVFPSVYRHKSKRDITLSKGSAVADIWQDIPYPIYEKLYFFNITNGDEFLKNHAKLKVAEVGPFTFRTRWVKEDLKWNPNSMVSYQERRTYDFIRDLSVDSQDKEIYTLNGPLIIASDILKQYDSSVRANASDLFKELRETVIIKKKISELAFGGYDDGIIKWAIPFIPDIPYKDGKFAWMYDKNDTSDGMFTVYTGEDDSSETGIISTWNQREKLDFWSDDTCNMINGTNIEIGPPLPSPPETYTFFQTVFCRSLKFDYIEDRTDCGLPSKRFEPTAKVFANSSDNPDNICYEVKKERASGVLDVSSCHYDAPVLISFPHFLMADSIYSDAIDGMNSSKDAHGSYIDVEPHIGLSVNISLRYQVNLEVNGTDGVTQMVNVPEGVFPIFWTSIEVAVDDEWANFIRNKLENPRIMEYTVAGFLILVSSILMALSICLWRRSSDEVSDPMLSTTNESTGSLRGSSNTDYGASRN